MKLFKDYNLIGNRLYKFNLDESKHLLHQKGSVPCIEKKLWDTFSHEVREIAFRTNKGKTFRVDKGTFDKHKQEIDLGFGKQYWIERKLWDISDPQEEAKWAHFYAWIEQFVREPGEAVNNAVYIEESKQQTLFP